MFKIEAKNLYGIKEKISLETNGNHLVIFAPNGVGKSSLARGIDEVMKNEEYDNLEKTQDQELNITIGKKVFNYNHESSIKYTGISNATLNRDSESNFNNLLNIVATLDEENKDGSIQEYISKEISAFWKNCKKESGQEANHYDIFTFETVDDIIQNVDEILSKKEYIKEELSVEKLQKKKESLNNILSAINGLKRSEKSEKIYKFANRLPKVNDIQVTGESKVLDYKIINDIKNKERDHFFAYKPETDKEFQVVAELSDDFLSELSKVSTKSEVKFILSLVDIKDNNNLLKKSKNGEFSKKGTVNSLAEKINKEISGINKNLLASEVIKNEGTWHKIKKEYEKSTEEIKNRINENIKTINSFFTSNVLDWRFEIKEIKSLSEEKNFKISNSEGEQEYRDFIKYASEGQKRIIFLIARLCESISSSNPILVIDDALLSLDNHHIDEVMKVLNHYLFSRAKFIIMAHNFEWYRTLAFGLQDKKTSFYVWDKCKDGLICKSFDKSEITDIMSVSSFEKIKDNVLKKILSLANILREVIANYISTKQIPIYGLNSKENSKRSIFIDKEILNAEAMYIIEFCDQLIRHYKGNANHKIIQDEYMKLLENLSIRSLPILQLLKDLLENNFKDTFGEAILKENYNFKNVSHLTDYIMNKILLGTKVRFHIEKKQFYSDVKNKEEIIAKWESKDKWYEARNLIPDDLKKLQSYETNYLVHVNNIQWYKIVEMPIYKIEKQLDNAQ